MAGNARQPGGTQHNTRNGGLLGARAGADIGLSSTFSVTERSECSRCKRSLRVGGNSASSRVATAAAASTPRQASTIEGARRRRTLAPFRSVRSCRRLAKKKKSSSFLRKKFIRFFCVCRYALKPRKRKRRNRAVGVADFAREC